MYYSNDLGLIQCVVSAAIGIAMWWILRCLGTNPNTAAGWAASTATLLLAVWDLRVRVRAVKERGERLWSVLTPERGGVMVVHTFIVGIAFAVLCITIILKG